MSVGPRKRKTSRKTCLFFFNEIRLRRVKYAIAYEIASLKDIVNLIKSNYLNGQEIDALLTYPNILGAIYDEWISGSYTSNDELKYCLIKCVELRYEDLKTEAVKVGVNKEALEVWEQMYDINGDLQFPVYDEALDEEAGEEFEP